MDEVDRIDDWAVWHDAYEDQSSELFQRMQSVREQVRATVEHCPAGPVTVVSICGGQGRELIGALEDHPRRDDVRGRLVELDVGNATFARRWARHAHLDGLEVVNGDASISATYKGLPPVDLVVMSGVLGHLHDDDRRRLIGFLHSLCRPGASVVWTSHRTRGGPAEVVRRMFAERSFTEVSFDDLPGDKYRFTVARHRYTGSRAPFIDQRRVFTFGSSRGRRPPDDL